MTTYIFNGMYDEYVNEAINGIPNKTGSDYNSGREPSEKWDNHTLAQAKELALNGDIESAKNTQKTFLDISNLMIKNAPRYDIEYAPDGGEFIDAARFVSGVPECFGRFISTEKTYSQNISIGINMIFSSKTNGAKIAEYGARIAGIVSGLIASGINIDLYVYYSILGREINNKSYEQHKSEMIIRLNNNNFSKTCAAFSTYFMRRIMFLYSESRSDSYIKDMRVGYNYGNVSNTLDSREFDINLNDSKDYLYMNNEQLVKVFADKIKNLKEKPRKCL